MDSLQTKIKKVCSKCGAVFEPQSIPLDRDCECKEGASDMCKSCHLPSLDRDERETFKNTIQGSPVLSPEYIQSTVLPQDIKDFMIKNIPWKKDLPTPNLTPESTEMEEWETSWWDNWVEFTNHQRTSEEVFIFLKNFKDNISQKLVSELKEKIEGQKLVQYKGFPLEKDEKGFNDGLKRSINIIKNTKI